MRFATRAPAVLIISLLLALSAPLGALGAEESAEIAAPPAAEGAAEAAEEPGGTPEAGETTAEPTEEERLAAVEAKVDVLAHEIARALVSATVPEDGNQIGMYGLGPAASKVYTRDRGLSIGSYGDIRFQGVTTDGSDGDNVFDALRVVLYLGYKFNDRIVLNTEIEFEHAATDKEGSASVEFATLDFFATDNLAARGGLVLIPMGFVNEMHEPTTYFGAARPEPEKVIIPSTWREPGMGSFGTLFDRVHYRVYAVTGLRASGFSVKGLRGGRQKGSKAIANNWAFVARADVDVVRGLMIGGSVYTGYSGQGEVLDNGTDPETYVPSTLTTLYELHAQYRYRGLSIRGLFTQAFLQDTVLLNFALGNAPNSGESIAETMLGGYAEIGYDVLPIFFDDTKMSLEPFFRYERVDTQNQMAGTAIRNLEYVQNIYTVGASYKPIPEVVIKLDYRKASPLSDPDDQDDKVQFSFGYAF
jgi:hypothetical protein